jgi:hypothetical protein
MNIALRNSPLPNDWGYAGPAAHNPYFHPKGTEPDYTFVPDYYALFDAIAVYNTTNGQVNHYVNPKQSASPSGAQEALRLVQLFVPGATLEAVRGIEGGIYYADKLTYSVVLPNGRRLNAAGIVDRYYHAGAGVSVESDLDLIDELEVPRPAPGPVPAAEIPPTPPAPVSTQAPTPEGEGPLGRVSGISAAQHELRTQPDGYAVGDIFTDSKGVKHLKEAWGWRVVK